MGTPWHLQGRVVGHGLDCVGVPLHVAKVCGYECHDCEYDITTRGDAFLERLGRSMNQIPTAGMVAGDLAVFWVHSRSKLAQHCGVMIDDDRMVHALQRRGVFMGRLSQGWGRRLLTAFRFRRCG